MIERIFLPTLVLFLSAPLTLAAEPAALKDPMDRINYSIGYQVGADFLKQKIELRGEVLLKGLGDALGGGRPMLSKPEMHALLVDLKQQIVAAEKSQRQTYLDEGRAFMKENAQKAGVVSLPSGVEYQVLRAGNGQSPSLDSTVRIAYRGTRLDGQEFDSTYRDGKPAEFSLAKLIPGLREALQLMREGAQWRVFIPAERAFGETGPLADQTVIFDVELLKVMPST